MVEDGNGNIRRGRVTALGTISNHAYYPNSNIRGMYMWSAIWWKNFNESAPPAAKLDYEAGGKQTVILLSLRCRSGPANIAFVSSWLAGYFTEDDKVGVAENCLMVSLPQQIKHFRITVNSAISTFYQSLLAWLVQKNFMFSFRFYTNPNWYSKLNPCTAKHDYSRF